MSAKMSRNKKKKLKKKAKKVAELREIQMQQLAEVEMREQMSSNSCRSRLDEDYEDDNVRDDRNGLERMTKVNEEIAESMASCDHQIHTKSLTDCSSRDICNGHNYNSCVLSDDSHYNDCNSRVIPNDNLNMDCNCVYPLSSGKKSNRLERSESTLVSNHKSKESGMRRVASCPGIDSSSLVN
jgi:hypothetical protein